MLNVTFKARPDPLDLAGQLNGITVASINARFMPEVVDIARQSGVVALKARKPSLISQGIVETTGAPPRVLLQFKGSFVAHIQDIGAKAHTIKPAALRRLAVTAARMNKTGRNLSRKEAKALLKHGDNAGRTPMLQLKGGGWKAEALKGGNSNAGFAMSVRHPGVHAEHFTTQVAKTIEADVQGFINAMKDVDLVASPRGL